MPDPTPPTPPTPDPKPDPKPDLAAELAALKAELAALKAPKPDPSPDPDLTEKARLAREAKEKEDGHMKAIEGAVRFDHTVADFLKTNASLLPPSAQEIYAQAQKENYGGAIEKVSALKAGLVQSFFSVQANVDILTPAQKVALDDYLKLTKTEKQVRAQSVYEMLFEPAFESLKREKRAAALSRGHGGISDSESAYKNKLIAGTKQHYLGEKSNGA